MSEKDLTFDVERSDDEPDPDETPIRDRKVITQPYDLGVSSLMEQISSNTIFLRPLSDRPEFQRRYVWSDLLASRLIESILLNVPIPPCYFSQNDAYELDVIDGQQRLFSIYRFINNQFALSGLEVLKEYNESRYHEMPQSVQRQLMTHSLRCVLITNESHPEIKFDVFERLNTNTVPLNSQELRNCVYRGALNSLLQEVVAYEPWLNILGKKRPDTRMRDEELALRFFAFYIHKLASYRTPQKHWLNETAKSGMKLSKARIVSLRRTWENSIDQVLEWFEPNECFRRNLESKAAINRALFDLLMLTAAKVVSTDNGPRRVQIRNNVARILKNEEFVDLISRAVDHKTRTIKRFEMWNEKVWVTE